jgi:serine/threonine-protein kinase
MNLDVGSVVGDYQIIGVLGAGGMGKVFKVRNTISDRVEAMKVLLPDLAGEPDLADRFLREIKVLASLNHPNIAGLRTALRFENQLLMIMEFVEGISLEQRLQKGRLPVPEAAGYISQVLAALSYAHATGVIHRDIKPANMMVTPQGTVKLMDFGIAKSAADRKLTMTGTTMGSLYYMSPEQINGTQTLDARSDLYSVGVSLYELITGKHPFDGDSQFAIMSAHLKDNPVPPIQVDPTVPQALNDLILFSVGREPASRFQSADAFRNALHSVMGARAPVAAAAPPPAHAVRTESLPPQVVPPGKSHRALWATVGALCFAGALIAAIEFGPWKKTSAGSAAAPVKTEAAVVPAAPAPAPAAAPAPPPAADPAPQPAVPKKTATAADHPMRPAVSTPPAVAAADLPPQPPPQTRQADAPAMPQAPAMQPQPDQAAKRAELQKVRESLVQVSARASAVHGTLENVERRQAASGLGMRRDWVQARSLMDSFLQGANDALAAGDAEGAKDFLEKGERQLEILEKALR